MSRNIIWEWGTPRTLEGYWDMGSITIPPKPVQVVLVDRVTAAQWLVTYVPLFDDGHGHITPAHLSLSASIPTRRIDKTGTLAPQPDVFVYSVNEEPALGVLGSNAGPLLARLTAQSGNVAVGLEGINPQRGTLSDPPLYVRYPNNSQIVVRVTVNQSGTINLQEITI